MYLIIMNIVIKQRSEDFSMVMYMTMLMYLV